MRVSASLAARPHRFGCLSLLAGLAMVLRGWSQDEAFPEFKPAAARAYLRAVTQSVEKQLGDEPDACFSLARARNQIGEPEAAERLARQALGRGPTKTEVYAFLADVLIRQDRMEEAARVLKDALALVPEARGINRRLGMVLDRLGDRDGAGRAFESAVRQAPEDAHSRLLLGRWLLDQGRVDEAAQQLQQSCQLDPKLAGAFYALSQAQTRRGDSASAQVALRTFEALKQQEIAELDVRNRGYDDEKFMRVLAAGFHTETAGCLLRRGRNAEAEAHLQQAIRIAPNELAAQEMWATLLLRTGRLPEARAVFETLVALAPKQASYHVNLGTVLLQLKEYPRAVEELKLALQLDPRHTEALNNLARVYLGAGRELPAALELAGRLVQLQPAAASYDLLGWALYANGQTNEARAAAAQAVARDPTNAVYQERLRRLGAAP